VEAIDRIKKIEVLDEYFDEKENLKEYLDNNINIWFPDKRNIKAAIKVEEGEAEYFRKRTYFPYQKIKKTNKDGSIVIEMKIGDFMEVIPTILRWIPHVQVISPIELKNEVKDRLLTYLQKD